VEIQSNEISVGTLAVVQPSRLHRRGEKNKVEKSAPAPLWLALVNHCDHHPYLNLIGLDGTYGTRQLPRRSKYCRPFPFGLSLPRKPFLQFSRHSDLR